MWKGPSDTAKDSQVVDGCVPKYRRQVDRDDKLTKWGRECRAGLACTCGKPMCATCKFMKAQQGVDEGE